MAQTKREYVNIHGRTGGRGLRPWILLPKLGAVAVFAGSYVSATVLWFNFRWGYASGAVWPVHAVSLLFRTVIVPSLIATLFFGLLLFLQHPRVFIRRRWLQLKLVIAALLPVIHLIARRNFEMVKAGLLEQQDCVPSAEVESACARFSVCLALGLSGALLLVILGRLKPRLGQDPKPLRSVKEVG